MSTDDIRSRILEAAGPVFADKGYRAATVRAICLAAGVNVASVNYYFGDKEQLYIEAVRRAHELTVTKVPLRDWPPGTAPAARLHDFIRTLIDRLLGGHEAPWQTRLMMREILQPSAACRALVEDYFRPHMERLLAILDDVVPPEMPPYRRQQIAFSIVGQCVYYRVAAPIVTLLVPEQELAAHYTPPQLTDHIAAMTLAALGLRAPLGEPSSHGPRRAAVPTSAKRAPQ